MPQSMPSMLATVPEEAAECAGSDDETAARVNHPHAPGELARSVLLHVQPAVGAAPPHWETSPLPATPWPADQAVSGRLQLRASGTRRRLSDRRVVCVIDRGTMAFQDDPSPHPGGTRELAQVAMSDIMVTVLPDQTRKFSICGGLAYRDSTEVWCCFKEQGARNQWLAVLHQMGLDLYCDFGGGDIRRVRRGVQQAQSE